MTQTILITGSSSGIGKSTAELFYKNGWNVIATMRNPAKSTLPVDADRMFVVALDVENKESIEKAVSAGIEKYGKIDALLNNAGYGTMGILESGTDAQIRKQFDVNFFGLIDTIKAVLPHMRKEKDGLIINVSSIGGRLTLPTWSIYHASKFAVEWLTESISFELEQVGIRVKLIEPGGIKTNFDWSSMELWEDNIPSEYKSFFDKVLWTLRSEKVQKTFSTPELVADTIYRAATDGKKNKLRYLVGKDAKQFAFIRHFLGANTQIGMVKKYFGL